MAMTAKRSREAPITFPHSSSFFCPMSGPQQDGGPHRKACEDIGNGLHDLGAGGDAGDIRRIAEKMLGGLKQQLLDLGITAEFTPEAVEAVANAGFDPVYGARPLRRAIRSKLEDPISEAMLEGRMKQGGRYTVSFSDGK